MSWAPRTIQTVVPTSGGSGTIQVGNDVLFLMSPATAIAAYTVNFPLSPNDRDRVAIAVINNGITVLTLAGSGSTLLGSITTLVVNGFARWEYAAASTSWVRIG